MCESTFHDSPNENCAQTAACERSDQLLFYEERSLARKANRHKTRCVIVRCNGLYIPEKKIANTTVCFRAF